MQCMARPGKDLGGGGGLGYRAGTGTDEEGGAIKQSHQGMGDTLAVH